MKTMTLLLLCGALATTLGCNKNTSGGPGTELPASEQATFGQTDDTFSLTTPMMATKVVQGGNAVVTIGINRGDNLDQDVTVSFGDLPGGLSVDPMSSVIMRDQKEVMVTVTAATDASLGDFTIKVLGHPTEGSDASSDLKITVAEN